MADIEVSADVQAGTTTVWGLVSDITRMGEWSPENTGGRWLGDADGPAVGARFKGSNRKGLRRWSTTCTVTESEPGVVFAFDVDYGPVAISHWRYDFRETAEGATTVVEQWTDRRPTWMKLAAVPVMGVADRGEHNRRGMEATLAAVKRTAERSA